MNIRLITTLGLGALLILFTLQNYRVAELRLFFWTVEMSLAVMVFIVFSIGVILGWILRSFKG